MSTPQKQISLTSQQDWDSLIDDFQNGTSSRLKRWTSSLHVILDLSLSSLSLSSTSPKLKLSILTFLDEFSLTLFSPTSTSSLDRLITALHLIIQSPTTDTSLKEHALVTATSVFISLNILDNLLERLIELLLVVINRPNHGFDRTVRRVACECLRELENSHVGLLSEVVGHFWGLCQNERTHASQSYLLLYLSVLKNVVQLGLTGSSVLSCSIPLTPFNVPRGVISGWDDSGSRDSKELRKAVSFLLDCVPLFTPFGMVEFFRLLVPLALELELQPSMLKVKCFSMVYGFNPVLCHVVLVMFREFVDSFDGQECEIAQRLVLAAKETQHHLVFRLLYLHWLSGLLGSQQGFREKVVVDEVCSNFFPGVFDPLALKAMKLDLLAFSLIHLDSECSSGDADARKSFELFKDGLVSVSGFKWLPPWSTETAVAFRSLHKLLIGASSHSEIGTDMTKNLTKSAIFQSVKDMLVSMTLDFHRLVPVIVSFIDRLLGYENHYWLGECLLQTFDEHLIPKVAINHKLISYFAIIDRIAGNDTIPPHRLLELLIKFTVYLVKNHDPDKGLKSWSQGSKVLCIARTLLKNHPSSRLFILLSRLLAFTCLYFPDLEVRDNARIYLRMLICIPGKKLRAIIYNGEQLLGISPSPRAGSIFSVQSPRSSVMLKKSRNLSSCIHLERVTPLLVKQSWSLALSTLGIGNNNLVCFEGIKDNEPQEDERGIRGETDVQSFSGTERIDKPPEPLRVMDSNISEILEILRRHFSCIPDYRHMPGVKVRIQCNLWFESEPFSQMFEVERPSSESGGADSIAAIYATLLKFSSSAPYGSIPSNHVAFLLGNPTRSHISDQNVCLDIVPVENGGGNEDSKAPVAIDLQPREPTPGLVDILIETNTENGQIIQGPLQSITVGIEDMFLETVIPPDIPEDATPSYYVGLYNALWEACGTPSSIGRETFPLKGSKGVVAIKGTQSVKLLEVSSSSVIHAVEQNLAPFVVSVVGQPLVDIIREGGIVEDVIWKYTTADAGIDADSVSNYSTGPLCLKYIDDEDDEENHANIRKKNMGHILILIFLPPRFHLLFQLEVSDVSTLVRIRTDHWPCLAYIDDYLEALFLP